MYTATFRTNGFHSQSKVTFEGTSEGAQAEGAGDGAEVAAAVPFTLFSAFGATFGIFPSGNKPKIFGSGRFLLLAIPGFLSGTPFAMVEDTWFLFSGTPFDILAGGADGLSGKISSRPGL